MLKNEVKHHNIVEKDNNQTQKKICEIELTGRTLNTDHQHIENEFLINRIKTLEKRSHLNSIQDKD